MILKLLTSRKTMLTQRALVGVVLAFCLLLCVPSSVRAQSDPIFERGFKPYGSFQNGDIDSVNLLNRELNLHIPLFSLPQRGGKLHFGSYVTYDANLWIPSTFSSDCSTPCWGYFANTTPMAGLGSALDFRMWDWRTITPQNVNIAAVVTADGTEHAVSGALSTDGTGYQINPALSYNTNCPYTDYVKDRNGIAIRPNPRGGRRNFRRVTSSRRGSLSGNRVPQPGGADRRNCL